MKKIYVFCQLLLAVYWSPIFGQQGLEQLTDLKEIELKIQSVAQRALPSTVALIQEDASGSGSGIIVNATGLIYTAAHVIQGQEYMAVIFPDGTETRGKVLGANFSKDIGMVQILEKRSWPFMPIGNSSHLKAGDWVVAMGHSTGYHAGRTPPVRFGRVVSTGPGYFFSTDCTLIGGDSGGPIFDLEGRIIGVNSSIGESLKNNNHAGVDGFKVDESPLLQGKAWGELTMNTLANPDLPSIGIAMDEVGLSGGILITDVFPNTPAAKAALMRNDVIIALNDKTIRGGMNFLQLLAKNKPGDEVKLSIQRNRETIEKKVLLARRGDIYE